MLLSGGMDSEAEDNVDSDAPEKNDEKSVNKKESSANHRNSQIVAISVSADIIGAGDSNPGSATATRDGKEQQENQDNDENDFLR